ncbi:hypothetical protein SNE25_08000 [Mucilaginibacter sabulilitoris]|uniref:YceI family protein n=1 Tax=Mucilaginibacter sabulilitoris TaxID=1173583 RepID=A0ABZ0TUK3_9SPHI|nr:hypothetical protein [Mucilaginibacter sabulilitoris]WPU95464.1 hypothetical protein SNE25_08000 [Mucilaginibacter sabulilitoris]
MLLTLCTVCQGQKLKPTLHLTKGGTYNIATGWISESKTKQMISGTVEIKDNTKVPGGITFPMSVVNESVTTDK